MKYREGNRTVTVTGDPNSTAILAAWKPGVSAVLESKPLRGTTFLVYSVKIVGISEDKADLNNSLAFFQRRLQAGKFSCSIFRRSKVSFKLNLTQSDPKHCRRHGKCIAKMDGLIPHNIIMSPSHIYTGSPPFKLNSTQSDHDNYTRYGRCE